MCTCWHDEHCCTAASRRVACARSSDTMQWLANACWQNGKHLSACQWCTSSAIPRDNDANAQAWQQCPLANLCKIPARLTNTGATKFPGKMVAFVCRLLWCTSSAVPLGSDDEHAKATSFGNHARLTSTGARNQPVSNIKRRCKSLQHSRTKSRQGAQSRTAAFRVCCTTSSWMMREKNGSDI